MKKVSIVLLDKDKQNSLKSLKKLGILHLSENFGLNENVKAIEEKIKHVETSLRFTEEHALSHNLKFDEEEVISKVDLVVNQGVELTALEEEVAKINRDIELLEPWGDFNPSDLKLLEDKGIKVSLVELSKEQYANIPAELNYFNLGHTKLGNLIAVIGDLSENYVVFEPPELGMEGSLKHLDSLKVKIKGLMQSISDLSKYHHNILTYKKLLEDRLEFEKVKAGMGYDEDFSVLEGWIPTEKVEDFKLVASKKGWGIGLSDPIEGDETPTLLKSGKIVSMIHPVMDFLGNLPGYWEKDVSPFFLVFFGLFFGMIIGDAGYGMIFLLITAAVQFKIKKFNTPLALFYYLSSCTVIWGALTGTWFASESIKGLAIMQTFQLPQISTGAQVMKLCFDIALIHLFLARIFSFFCEIKKGIAAIADLGWALMLLGLYFLVLNMVLDATMYPMPSWAFTSIIVGFVVVIIFGEQTNDRNFFKSLLFGIAGLPLKILDSIGVFSDIISYVRLYAVGLAGIAVAQSFNFMAAPMIESGNGMIIPGLLILLVGHAFNIAMAALSVLVHGIRLNVLEFSNHSGLNWTGIKYSPFREKNYIHN
ncbi:V-type ATP synthase subunit I [Thiospirochaeta perfilievii]|uniref:V-type ATP synthase subunit I n=1 Tax=Thiospirochaeta perfilievii TaxID=252967 RepID=A0A5C1QDZ3_9SPIO|nr:V-type ATP synthase subunit I [Thiospirochaeta perfilievii]QEN05801.1 V-type ATP synthase subunit I [Thiospirochaeta perfilievii]